MKYFATQDVSAEFGWVYYLLRQSQEFSRSRLAYANRSPEKTSPHKEVYCTGVRQ
jgi:hypothetical protein